MLPETSFQILQSMLLGVPQLPGGCEGWRRRRERIGLAGKVKCDCRSVSLADSLTGTGKS